MNNQFEVGDIVMDIGHIKVGDRVRFEGYYFGLNRAIGVVIGLGWAKDCYSVDFGKSKMVIWSGYLTKVTSDRLIDAAKERQQHEKQNQGR